MNSINSFCGSVGVTPGCEFADGVIMYSQKYDLFPLKLHFISSFFSSVMLYNVKLFGLAVISDTLSEIDKYVFPAFSDLQVKFAESFVVPNGVFEFIAKYMFMSISSSLPNQ